MKIGFVLDDSLDKTDGVQQYILTLGRWLSSRGHEVHYLVGETNRGDIPRVHSLSRNIQVNFNQNRMSMPFWSSKAAIRTLLRNERFDILHVQMPYSPLLAARIVKLAPAETAIVGTFHVIPYSRFESLATRLLSLWLRRSRKRFSAVFSVSKPAQVFARRAFRVKTAIIPNVVNVQHLASGKKPRQYRDDKLTIVFLGRLVERKGVLQFVEVLRVLQEKHELNRVRVLICGKGPLEQKLKRLIESYRLKHVVQFKGYISEDEKPNILAAADIAVFPSLGAESFGIVLLEAMAAGAQVVLAGNNRGYRWVMAARPDQLVKPENTKAFAKTLAHFIRNYRARQSAARWQHEYVRQFDVREIGSRLLTEYASAIAKVKI